MSEREIRGALKQFCQELDVRAGIVTGRRVCQAFVPVVLGAGLAVTACDDETDTTPTGVTPSGSTSTGTMTGTTTTGSGTGTGNTGGAGGMTPSGGESGGMGGATGGAGGATGGMGMGGALVYMAPDV